MSWITTETDLILVQNYGIVSSTELARRCGAPSRSAVISRAHRLGLAVGRKQKRQLCDRAQRRIAQELRQASRSVASPAQAEQEPPTIVTRPAKPAKPPRKTGIVSITPPIMTFTECQWIKGSVNAANWDKCGKPVHRNSAWCEEHYHRVYRQGAANDD